LFVGGQAEPDERVGLAGAGVPEQDRWFAGVEMGAGGERGQPGGLDGWGGVEVERAQPNAGEEPDGARSSLKEPVMGCHTYRPSEVAERSVPTWTLAERATTVAEGPRRGGER
jgi:hypothetical protein